MTAAIVAGALMLAVVAAPHVVDLRRSAPAVAIVLWSSALLMRALLVLGTVAVLMLVVPRTPAFTAVTHWCWQTVLPLIAAHLGLNGHRVGDAAVVLPAVILALSVASVVAGVIRAARAVRALVSRACVARGPGDSLIVQGPEIFVAASGLTRPRVLVSAGALTQLDDDELAASLDHERGHIARRHGWLLLVAELARGVARFVPGTRRTLEQLRLHVERDADAWALRRRHDPVALASAVCKAALSRRSASFALMPLGGAGDINDRLDELTEDQPERGGGRQRPVKALAFISVLVTLATAAALPTATIAAVEGARASALERHCVD